MPLCDWDIHQQHNHITLKSAYPLVRCVGGERVQIVSKTAYVIKVRQHRSMAVSVFLVFFNN